MHLGRLRLEVRPLGRADPPLPQAHGGQALPVRRVQPQLLPLRPPGAAHEEAPELSCPRPPPPAPRSPLSRSLNYMIDSIYIYIKENENIKLEMYILYIWENREYIVLIPKCLVLVRIWNACYMLAWPRRMPSSQTGSPISARAGRARVCLQCSFPKHHHLMWQCLANKSVGHKKTAGLCVKILLDIRVFFQYQIIL